jgi:pimeloyl-ACP methyl ester carboxylesterase
VRPCARQDAMATQDRAKTGAHREEGSHEDRRLAGSLATLLLLLSACTGPAVVPPSSPAPARSLAPSPAATRPPITLAGEPMSPCTAGSTSVVCGTLRVPEDRSNPAGRHISLSVAVIPAVAPVPKPDPLFPIDGGPGGAATEDLGWTASIFRGIHEDRDIVLVDQRGTGGSNRLVAPAGPDTTGLSEAEQKATIDAWLKQVLAEMPGDPRFYTTSVAMDDLDDVRAALGYDQINLYGPSYGATAAQYYLRQHEDRVRAVVLDGGTLLDVPILELIAANSQRALDILFDRCAADRACKQAFPDLRAEFDVVMKRISKHPVTTSVSHPWTGDPIVVDAPTFAAAVHGALLEETVIADLPRLVHAAYRDRWDQVAQAIALAAGPMSRDTGQLVMSFVIRCSEAWARFDPVETARSGAGSYLRDVEVAIAEAQATSCAYAPKGVVPADDDKPVTSDVPVLLVLGGSDPQNPPANVADAPRDLPNSLTLVLPGHAHTVGHLGCMPSIIESFIRAGAVDGLDVSCVSTGVPLPPFRTSP